MRAVGSARVQGERIIYGAHAVDRFRQRARPDLGFPDARETLRELLADAHIRRRRPAGISEPASLKDRILTVAWAVFEHEGRTLVLPLMPWPESLLATTCLVGGES